jgi:hypothetical protein
LPREPHLSEGYLDSETSKERIPEDCFCKVQTQPLALNRTE